MSKIAAILLSALSIAAANAQAHEVLVIQDTRSYVPFTASITGPLGCTMPKAVDKPNLADPMECRTTRSSLIEAGVLLTRESTHGTCSLTVFAGGLQRSGGNPAALPVPEQRMSTQVFKCDPLGGRAI